MTIDQVAFLASGWSLATAEAHGTSIALGTDDGTILVDAGGEATKGLVATFGLASLSKIYLTHEHPDHLWALPGLLHCLRFADERPPLEVNGPAPALERAQGAIEALGVTTPFEVRWMPIEVGVAGDGLARWAPADHSVPAVSYRFGDVVVCGDTAPSQHTTELAKGAALLIHEASHTSEELTHPHGHATPADAGKIAEAAEVDALALIHIHPSLDRTTAVEATGFQPTVAPIDGQMLTREEEDWKLSG